MFYLLNRNLPSGYGYPTFQQQEPGGKDINLLGPNIHRHILLTVPHIFLVLLVERI